MRKNNFDKIDLLAVRIADQIIKKKMDSYEIAAFIIKEYTKSDRDKSKEAKKKFMNNVNDIIYRRLYSDMD